MSGPGSNPAARQNDYFVDGAGIAPEVITAEICKYLGQDAVVRPGTHIGSDGTVISGYFLTAYRNLTSVSSNASLTYWRKLAESRYRQ